MLSATASSSSSSSSSLPSCIVVLKCNANSLARILKNDSTQAPSAVLTTNYDGAGNVGSPARTATPNVPGRVKDDQQQAGSSSRTPSAVPTERAAMPAEAAPNGAPTRVYLNQKVTQHVLDGMKMLAVKKPSDPLRVLGEFLLKRSSEVEAVPAGEDAVPTASEDKQMNGAEQ
ncbi:hypothetical protein M406DRAFT_251344 [Cryphonectria parasitica EP155]|uniref:Dpy-30 domain-containing protein n=1 Tax=Cryphonectria parasitica (strain ATCC 38755 / EP155) TaxID=660469 RepID=A0A9P4YAL0_CRYP1|nr:uncharacterized protein M406DRAFT_251344 [Cryphonectria parasitica EP155]KAF3769347.1 hypothetical protein M406DRAFT_251344 [Cryphonectria parasitica EP155]